MDREGSALEANESRRKRHLILVCLRVSRVVLAVLKASDDKSLLAAATALLEFVWQVHELMSDVKQRDVAEDQESRSVGGRGKSIRKNDKSDC